ncbi:MAG: hypothetical protein Q9207_006673 [Kuettlingeria erythrocarpa]
MPGLFFLYHHTGRRDGPALASEPSRYLKRLKSTPPRKYTFRTLSVYIPKVTLPASQRALDTKQTSILSSQTMKLHTNLLLTIATALTPAMTSPIRNALSAGENVPKLNERTVDSRIRDVGLVESRDASGLDRRVKPNVMVEIADPARIES